MHREAVDWEKDLELMVETVEAGGNDVLNPLAEKKLCSVVQTSVEVTEPSLQKSWTFTPIDL